MHGLLSRGLVEDDHRHLGVLAANVTPPLEGDALLSHGDVETMFHEAGHLLHHCLSRTELTGHAGTNVAWDFVELPSQILEKWCWENATRIYVDYVISRNGRDGPVNDWRGIPVTIYGRRKVPRTPGRSDGAVTLHVGPGHVNVSWEL